MSRRTPTSARARVSPAPRAALPRPIARLLPPLVIVLLALGAYATSFNGVFVLDEQSAIVENPNIRAIATSFSAPKDVGFAGRPVVSLSFALNYLLAPTDVREVFAVPAAGGDPAAAEALHRNLWGYHATNLAIHILAALALFGILRRTLAHPRLAPRFGTVATPLSFLVAALWVVHPLGTGSITYVAQRVESLMGLFFLLTVYCAIRAGEGCRGSSVAAGLQPRPSPWTAAAVASCALGMGTKEVMVAAPLVVLLYDLVFLQEAGSSSDPGTRPAPLAAVLSARWPLYVGFAACWALLAVLVVSNPRHASVGVGLEGWSSWLYLQTQAGVIVHYLRLALVPWPLVLDYEWPAAASLLSVAPQMILLAALLALTAWGLVRRQPAALLGAWFFLILAPSSSVLPIVTEIAAEHRMYLPLCAVLAGVVIGAWSVLSPGPSGDAKLAGRRTRPAAVVAIVAAALALGGCTWLTSQRNQAYASYERIWADTVTKRPGNARAHSNYGTVLFEQGRLAEAEAELRRAVAIRDAYPEAQANLGAVLCSQGKLEEGVPHLQRAIALAPGYRDAWRNLGEALATLGRNAEALDAYRRALVTAPDDPRLLSRVAWLQATSPEDTVRNGSAALRTAERAVQITEGRDADSLDTLAAAYAELERFGDAARTEEQAIVVARAAGQDGLLPDMQARLEMYRAGQKFRQAVPQRG